LPDGDKPPACETQTGGFVLCAACIHATRLQRAPRDGNQGSWTIMAPTAKLSGGALSEERHVVMS
jgi:hypothetical protein